MKQDTFMLDIKAIRDRARQHIQDGAKTAGYKAKVETVIKVLNDALATELVCLTVSVAARKHERRSTARS